MKKSIFLLILVIFALCLVQSVSAANIQEPVTKITPAQTSYTPGDRVTVTAEVPFATTGGSTFPGQHSVRAYTDLDNPEWVYTVKINGHGQEQTVSRQVLTISGYMLDYPSQNTIALSIVLTGTIPSIPTSGEKAIFSIEQINENGNTVSGSHYEVDVMVVIPEDIDKLRAIVESDLNTFDTEITDKLKTGVDVSQAQAKYDAAREKWIQSATASYATAKVLLDDAQKLITEGKTQLEKFWAQKSIDETTAALEKTAFYITDFKVNRSMTNDARVLNIETKVESAQSSLNSANGLMSNENYAQAYTVAETAHAKASEALASAEELYAEVSKGIIPDMGGAGIFIIIGIVVVIAIVGFFVYRRQTSWDELG